MTTPQNSPDSYNALVLRIGKQRPWLHFGDTEIDRALKLVPQEPLQVISMERGRANRMELASSGESNWQVAIESERQTWVLDEPTDLSQAGLLFRTWWANRDSLPDAAWRESDWAKKRDGLWADLVRRAIDKVLSKAQVDFATIPDWQTWCVLRSLAIDLATQWSKGPATKRNTFDRVIRASLGTPERDRRYDLELLVFDQLLDTV